MIVYRVQTLRFIVAVGECNYQRDNYPCFDVTG